MLNVESFNNQHSFQATRFPLSQIRKLRLNSHYNNAN